MVSLPGQALATQTLSIKGREEGVEGDGSDVIICVFTRDHGEESLPLPRDKMCEIRKIRKIRKIREINEIRISRILRISCITLISKYT